ncbi:methionyl-tRNA formyltransferase [Sphingobium sp. DEHP117]|uniref:methionyl-tRNA formyltransferase n=1 Tax=Sphingobium sp. DEHP117 TaxID=2993436 RepID=UPI0027D6301F|nr:methionyl-tRNA formyltransferase [Sphingobium sp. DEHP117]MDQ4419567.1 methionyl-tRNA formyltransferase [Sphingobium sp. DEHP117]
MKIIYMGTPDFAVPALEALHEAGHEIIAAYSQPPRPAGRGKALRPSPVHATAEAMGLEVRTPVSLKGAEEQTAFAGLNADVAVVAAYGLILPQAILDAPRHGCLNLHGSLLPRWRGAAPIQRAILAGDTETGVQVMQMEAGLDTGPVRATARTEVDGKTAGALTAELAQMGARLIVDTLADLPAYPPVAQAGDGVTYAAKITKDEARIDFAAGAIQAERQVRAFNPAPGAFLTLGEERFKLLAADVVAQPGQPGLVLDDRLLIGCGADSIRPTLIQRAGKGAMGVDELLRGFAIPAGTRLA